MKLTRLAAAAAAVALSLTAIPLTSSAAPISVGDITAETSNTTSIGKNYVFTQGMDPDKTYTVTPEDTLTFDNVYLRDPRYLNDGHYETITVLLNGTYRYYGSYIFGTYQYDTAVASSDHNYNDYWYGLALENVETGELVEFNYEFVNWQNIPDSDANYYRYFEPQGVVGASLDIRGYGDESSPLVFSIEPYYDANTVSAVSASLSNTLDMNFFITNVAKDTTLTLSGPNGDITLTYDQYKAFLDSRDTNDESVTYVLTYPLNATQADEKITLTAEKNGEEQPIFQKTYYQKYVSSGYSTPWYDYYDIRRFDKVEYTLNEYLKKAYDSTSNSQTRSLIKGLQNYTSAASNFFNGTDYQIDGISDVSLSDVEEYAPVLNSIWDYPSDPKENAKLSLVLNGKTELRMYWDYIDDDDPAYIYEDDNHQEEKDAITGRKNGLGYFAIPNITPKKLSKTYILGYSGDYFKFSALSYVYRVLLAEQNGDPAATPQLVDLAKALYRFAMEASKA